MVVGTGNIHWVFLGIVDAFVSQDVVRYVDVYIRVDGRSYLQSGAIDDSEANGIIRDPKQEVWNDCKSCKVRVGLNGNLLWEAFVLLGRKMRNGHVEVYGYAFWVNQCTSGFHGVNEPDDRGVTEGREDVREFFNNVEAEQRGSYRDMEGIKW
ncbi:hypothetical protein Tco_0779963, partial [Tanacetum coccineum]